MRITADLIQKSAQYLNALNEFHLDLRGYKIPFIENLTASNDQFGTIDLTDNEITKLENLPQLLRLTNLLLANNRISKVESNYAEMCEKLESLILTNNKIAKFEEINNIATCKTIIRLSLVGNIVTNLPNYRQYVIYKMPQLRVLDFQKVTTKEKEDAKQMFESGPQAQQIFKEMAQREQEMESNLKKEEKKKEGLGKEIVDQRISELEQLIAKAESMDEVQELEKQIQQLEEQRQ